MVILILSTSLHKKYNHNLFFNFLHHSKLIYLLLSILLEEFLGLIEKTLIQNLMTEQKVSFLLLIRVLIFWVDWMVGGFDLQCLDHDKAYGFFLTVALISHETIYH